MRGPSSRVASVVKVSVSVQAREECGSDRSDPSQAAMPKCLTFPCRPLPSSEVSGTPGGLLPNQHIVEWAIPFQSQCSVGLSAMPVTTPPHSFGVEPGQESVTLVAEAQPRCSSLSMGHTRSEPLELLPNGHQLIMDREVTAREATLRSSLWKKGRDVKFLVKYDQPEDVKIWRSGEGERLSRTLAR
ncbi:hypothetical protein NDU88_001997 [Pleurodeles waltl]|uniref:Uncharacterized protein n=1 Tax=Pleurodeles waltl TaxID=8319 RepID=A0AAV7NFV0_PLEWA|nr:hypothetical protein NDU88_001997 [Pleurodeles waltl]